LNNLLISKFT